MKSFSLPIYVIPAVLLSVSPMAFAADEAANANTVVLDATGVANLRIQTATVEEADFEQSVFSLGRIETIPGKSASVSSRISGRILSLNAQIGDPVEAGQEIAKIESRQPGDPPPTISLKAPINGMVTLSHSKMGDPVEPESALLEITDLSEVYAVARVPESQAGRMKPGTTAHIKVAALPDQKFTGELLRFGISADKESGTIDAIFRLPNKDGLLRNDMRAEFSIVVSKRANVLSVPRAALQGEASNRFVYVKHFDLANAFIKTPVQTGEINDRFAEITAGLFPADEVVTRGAYSLSFAGASSVSLKEALDAAHGHEHAADGSELTPEKKAEAEAKKHGTTPAAAGKGESPIWKYVSGVLGLLLLASFFGRRPSKAAAEEDAELRNNTTKEAR